MTDDATTGQASDFFAHLPKPVILPSPEEIYDALMALIEPELTTSQLPLLDEKYKGESVDEAKARQDRYQRAFMAYDEKFRQYRRDVEERSRNYQRDVMIAAEDRIRSEDNTRIRQIESQLS